MERAHVEIGRALRGYRVEVFRDAKTFPRVLNVHLQEVSRRPASKSGSGFVGYFGKHTASDPIHLAVFPQKNKTVTVSDAEQLLQKLETAGSTLGEHKITAFFEVHPGADFVLVKLHRAGRLGWFGRRGDFVSKLLNLQGFYSGRAR